MDKKKNGRVVSKETKKLFEDREKECAKNKPTQRRRRKWNKKIRNACRNDYRRWVSEWVQRIEEADNKGDTKAIYRGVKAVSGIGQGGTRTRPTMKTKKNGKKLEELGRFDGPEELAQAWQDFLDKKFSPTELEALRVEFESFTECQEKGCELTREEYDAAVKQMKHPRYDPRGNITRYEKKINITFKVVNTNITL